MEDCVFCRIVRGEIPALKIYEDSEALVFLDVAGDVDGHMLAIPKAHCGNVLDCPPEALAGVMRAVQRVSRHCVEACGYEGVNLLNASGACAGQSVPHLHFHLIPRRAGDGIDAWPKLSGARESREAVWQKLTMLLPDAEDGKPALRIRPAVLGDYAACAALEQDILELHRQNRPDFFRPRETALTEERFTALLEQANVFLVAELDGEVVGQAFAGQRGYNGHPGFNDLEWLEIDDIVVRVDCRGKGIGRALFAAMKAEARRQGFRHLELTVWGFNAEARHFYKALGMRTRIDRMELDLD